MITLTPETQVKCSYCPYTDAAKEMAIRIVGRGKLNANGAMESQVRFACADCLINLFDAVMRPKVVVPE